jgi:hypothetical protein
MPGQLIPIVDDSQEGKKPDYFIVYVLEGEVVKQFQEGTKVVVKAGGLLDDQILKIKVIRGEWEGG